MWVMSGTVKLLHDLLLHKPISSRLHFMCNSKSVIAALGGPSQVAKQYGFSVQRVCNWGVRGIPASVIIENPVFAEAIRAAGYRRNVEAQQAV
jgi:hypothetical protein